MLKLYILSDLHLEFGDFPVPKVDADVVVIAGDLHVGTRGLEWAAANLPPVPIIYVVGNHEYYRHSTPKLLRKLRATALQTDPRIGVLERESVSIDGVTFLGATLWSDFELLGERSTGMSESARTMADFQLIRVDPEYRRLRPQDVADVHVETRQWLADELNRREGSEVVVVTHHAPSLRSVAPEYRTDPVSSAFASDLEDLVTSSGASLWIHGHTHFVVDYRLGKTRVISNPRGYVPNDIADGFQPDLVVEM